MNLKSYSKIQNHTENLRFRGTELLVNSSISTLLSPVKYILFAC